VPLSEVTDEFRRRAKAINFGLIYGMSAFGLAKQLDLDRREAQHYIDVYFERYPGVLNYMEKTRDLARKQGFVETLFGRRLMVPDINARSHPVQKAAERMAINAPMQGTAADIIKLAMIAVADWLNTPAGQHTHMIMQVHDELVFEIKQEELEPARAAIQHLMENTVQLDIPLLVSIGVGKDWDSAH
jgi:DNA polymerase-1